MAEKLEGPLRAGAIAALEKRGWALRADRDAIAKTYRFKDFGQAWAFMSRVAQAADAMDHHPEWFNVYNRVDVTLSTHDAGGLTELDVALAGEMDAAAGAISSGGG